MTGPIIDMHAHFFPRPMFEAIWRFFESGGWGIAHKRSSSELAESLGAEGVERYATLNYVRRPGQAARLNEWTAGFVSGRPEAIGFGTVHAGDPDPWGTVAPYLEDGVFHGIKLQPLVCEFGVDDPRLETTLDRLEALDKTLVLHGGTAPYANKWVGLDRLERVLARRPGLRVVLAHMGAFETERALAMLEKYPGLYLDTAMIWVRTDLFDAQPKVPLELIEKWSDRILFGSDYPNIPYPYREAVDAITRLSISEEVKNGILRDNAKKLFGGLEG